MPRQARQSAGPRRPFRGRKPKSSASDNGPYAPQEIPAPPVQAAEMAARVSAYMKEGLTVEEAVAKAMQPPTPEPTPVSPETNPAPTENSTPLQSPTPAAPAPPVQNQPQPRPAPAPRPMIPVEGLLEISDKGYGFLRDPKNNYLPQRIDVFVLPEIIRINNLREGLMLKGEMVQSNRGPQLRNLQEVNGEPVEKYRDVIPFDQLTTINPNKRFVLETKPEILTTRVIDLVAPIGKGQRGLIVAPPRTGKTTLLQHIANAITINHPDAYLMVLLVDERPEEATEVRRNVKGDVICSTNDMNIQSHTHISKMAIEKAKRLAESGRDVFLLLDSLTRLGRAFNNNMGNSGRTLSGGMDARGMEIPRKIFAAARNTEEAGSLTIVASALIDTGSRMDELIFQEFKGTGNMELVLDRKLADARIFPAVDINKSGTRREELLVPAHELEKMNKVRRGLAGHQPDQAMERLLSFLQKYPTNSEFLRQIP
ncbi:transcription termination factor Rho [Oscillatoria laete-virens NRMC-F 0139]|nr:transcription termination factor Rho [Oscillatoria laete-virens]MDL5054710.1 transcription termination factor Rho [Oscillatoria laete-virens NRMC-F 0139]